MYFSSLSDHNPSLSRVLRVIACDKGLKSPVKTSGCCPPHLSLNVGHDFYTSMALDFSRTKLDKIKGQTVVAYFVDDCILLCISAFI